MANDSWQFTFVSIFGASTERVIGLAASVPLVVEKNNVPVGQNANTLENPRTVLGPYLLIRWGIPSDTVDYTFTGRVRIQRKSREFSRDVTDPDNATATLVADVDLSAIIGSVARDSYLDDQTLIDHDVGTPGRVWYYTIFYEVTINAIAEDRWACSPDASHARAYAYRNDVDGDGNAISRHGQIMYDLLPRQWRILDFREGGEAVFRLLQIFGRLFDQLREDVEHHFNFFADPENVDAALLPYIDWLLAWPTNFELPENARRRETTQAATLYKAKGTIDALQLALQTVTGYQVTIVEGWKWLMTSFDRNRLPLDPTAQPLDWNEPTDGVWPDLVNATPFPKTLERLGTSIAAVVGTRTDKLTYTLSREIVVPTGVGWPWQNPNGVLIILRPVEGVSDALPATVVAKVNRIAPLFAMHYAAFAIQLKFDDSEFLTSLNSDGDDYQDSLNYQTEEFLPALNLNSDNHLDVTPDLCHLYSYPHPDFPLQSVSNSIVFRTPHVALQYLSCMDNPNVQVEIVDELANEIVTELGEFLVE